MKWIFHFNSLEIKTKITKEQIKKYIDDGMHILYSISKVFLIYGYIYSLCAIDLFLNYISYNECILIELEYYYLNCLKIIITLYEDIYDEAITFNLMTYYTKIEYNTNDINRIQKKIMEFYEYNFNQKNIIYEMNDMNKRECLLIGRYIEYKIYKKKFLNMSPEEKIQKVLKKKDRCL